MKFAAGSQLPHLAAKVECLFKEHLIPNAVKNRAKTVEEVKEWKTVEKVFDSEEYHDQVYKVFKYFSEKAGNMVQGRKEETVKFSELVTMLTKAKMLKQDGVDSEDTAAITMKQLINLVERFYDPKDTLATKCCDTNFNAYLDANPMLLKSNRDAEEKRKADEEAAKQAALKQAEEGEEEAQAE